jgi:putative PIN family toxin of toxin-antitoxin system
VLAYPKFRLTALEQQTVLEAWLPYVQAVRTKNTTDEPRCRDPQDQEFLLLAAQGHADYLVTGDEDLLTIQGFEACPIMTPEHFKRLDYGGLGDSHP